MVSEARMTPEGANIRKGTVPDWHHREVSAPPRQAQPFCQPTLFFEGGSLSGLKLAKKTGCLVSPRDLPASASPALGLQACAATSSLFLRRF